MVLYACGNDWCCELVLRVSKGFPTSEPATSRVYYAQQGLVEEEEGMASTIC